MIRLCRVVHAGRAEKEFSEEELEKHLLSLDEQKRAEYLLEIRKNSFLPAQEVVNEGDVFADFLRDYQIRHRIRNKKLDKEKNNAD